jgi:cysteine desulfurase
MDTQKIIYMDHAATTPTDPRVVAAMTPYFTDKFTNPATLYTPGRENDEAIESARASIARAINAEPEEIYFTSGGTESDNWAVTGVAFANEKKGRHLIASSIEHHAVLETCEFLKKRGWDLTVLPVSKTGFVDPAAVEKAIRPDTVLVSIMHANNEIGTIEPIAEIAKIARAKNVTFHSDSVQTVGKIPFDAKALGADILVASAHKFYGPKGVGFSYIRKGTRIETFNHGGAQERNRRAGTHNVPGIIGMAKALELASESIADSARLHDLAESLWTGLSKAVPDMRRNSPSDNCLPGFLNIVVEGVEGEAMLLRLDSKGVCVSSGSACTTGSLEPSHVLLGIGLPPEVAHGSIRFTLGRENTEDDVNYVVKEFPPVIAVLRKMSPTYRKDCRKEGSRPYAI